MKIVPLNTLAKTAGRFIVKNSSVILTTTGVLGIVTTAALTYSATKKSETVISDAEFRRYSEWREEAEENEVYVEMDKKEHFKLVWKYYIPVVVSIIISCGSIIGAQVVSAKRQNAMAAIAAITESTLNEYQKKVIESIGEEAEHKIRESAYANRDKKIIENKSNLPALYSKPQITRHGDQLFFDELTGIQFYSDPIFIKNKENEFNRQIMLDGKLYLSDVYNLFDISYGYSANDYVWKADSEQDFIEFIIGSRTDENGYCYNTLDYSPRPYQENYFWQRY